MQCSVTCGVGEAQRSIGCRMENGSLVDSSYCSASERPVSVQQCVERPCPTEPVSTTTTTTTTSTTTIPTTLLPSTETPNVTPSSVSPTSSIPFVAGALAGYRPQTFEIHVDPSYNQLVPPAGWNQESNDVPKSSWRSGNWGEVTLFVQFF